MLFGFIIGKFNADININSSNNTNAVNKNDEIKEKVWNKSFLKRKRIILKYLVSGEDKKINNEDIINYFDIGSSLSLFSISNYFNNNYKIKTKFTIEKIKDLFFSRKVFTIFISYFIIRN